MIDEAKIGGMTPDMLSFSGRCELWPAIDLVADLALGVVDQNLALAALDEHHERGDDRSTSAAMPSTSGIEYAPVRASSSVPPIALGSPAAMPAKIISEMPLPSPRSVICSPSHIRNMVPVTSVTTAVSRKPQARIEHQPGLRLERDRDPERLEERERQRRRSACTG